MHAPPEDKDDTESSFYEDLYRVFGTILEASHENFVRTFQFVSRYRRYFQTNSRE
jgi:hypothetical protein